MRSDITRHARQRGPARKREVGAPWLGVKASRCGPASPPARVDGSLGPYAAESGKQAAGLQQPDWAQARTQRHYGRAAACAHNSDIELDLADANSGPEIDGSPWWRELMIRPFVDRPISGRAGRIAAPCTADPLWAQSSFLDAERRACFAGTSSPHKTDCCSAGVNRPL